MLHFHMRRVCGFWTLLTPDPCPFDLVHIICCKRLSALKDVITRNKTKSHSCTIRKLFSVIILARHSVKVKMAEKKTPSVEYNWLSENCGLKVSNICLGTVTFGTASKVGTVLIIGGLLVYLYTVN